MVDRYDAIVIGLGGMGSATAFHLARRGRRHPRPRAVRAAPRARLVARPQPDHPPRLPRASRLRPAPAPQLRAVARARGVRGRTAPRHDGKRRGRARGRPDVPRGAPRRGAARHPARGARRAPSCARRHPAYAGFDECDPRRVAAGRRLPAGRAHDPGPCQRSAGGRRRPALRQPGSPDGSRRPTVAFGCGTAAAAPRRTGSSSAVAPGWAPSFPRLAPLAVPERQVVAWLRPLVPDLFAAERSPSS